MHFRESRLLGLVFPNEVIPVLVEIANDPTTSLYDKVFATKTLGSLAESGDQEAKAAQLVFTSSPSADLSNAGVGLLSGIDVAGEHRGVYWDTFPHGSDAAVHAISVWPDAERVSQLLKLRTQGDDLFRAKADMVLGRYETPLSGEWVSRLTRCIEVLEGDVEWSTLWAIEAAKAKSMPGLKECLRIRLNANNEAVIARLHREKREGRSSGPGINLEDVYPVGDGGPGIIDPCHDDALLAYYRQGGELTNLEKKRLQYHGYPGDPKERLIEIVKASK